MREGSKYPKWTEEEIKLLKSGLSTAEIMELTDRTYAAIKCKRSKLIHEYKKHDTTFNYEKYYKSTAYSKNHNKRWTGNECDIVLHSELTDMELSELLGRSVGSIQIKRHYLLQEADSQEVVNG